MSITRHTTYNMLGAILPVAASLITIPIYLRMIGLDRYGVLSICWLLLGYFNLFDLGLGRAVNQKLATLHESPDESRSDVFWTGVILSLLLASLGAFVFLPLAYWGIQFLKLGNAGLIQEVFVALPWLAAAVPLGIFQSLFSGVLEGRQRFAALNLINATGTIAMSMLPLAAAALYGPAIKNLVLASLLARVTTLGCLAFASFRSVPVRQATRPDTTQLRELLHFGGWATVTNTISPLLHFWDRFAIGTLLSSTAVGLYVIPFNIVSQLSVLPQALSSALFPRLAAAGAEDGEELIRRAVRALAFVLTPLTVGAFLFSEPFLHLWLGKETGSAAAPIGFILLAGFWANSLARIPFAQLQAHGRPDIVAQIHFVELLPYAAALYVGILWFGLKGAAAAWSLRAVADCAALFRFSEVPSRALRPLRIDAALILAALVTSILLPIGDMQRLALLSLLLGCAVIVAVRRTPDRLLVIGKQFRDRFFASLP